MDFSTLGSELKRAGLAATNINQVFNSTAHEQNFSITGIYLDVYNRSQPGHEERQFDATNFIDYLQDRQSIKGLYFAI